MRNFFILLCMECIFLSAMGDASKLNVAEIVKAISNVQDNVPNAKNIVPNIKVLGEPKLDANKDSTSKNDADIKDSEQKDNANIKNGVPNVASESEVGNEIDEAAEITTVASAVGTIESTESFNPTDTTEPTDTIINQILKQTAQVQNETPVTQIPTSTTASPAIVPATVSTLHSIIATTESYSPVTPDPLAYPESGIFTFSGMNDWRQWGSNMRDPSLNPNGVSIWPVVAALGVQGIAQHYNPIPTWITGRAIQATNTADALLSVYAHRNDIIDALQSNKLEPSLNSIIEFSKNLERKKFIATIGDLLRNNSRKAVVPNLARQQDSNSPAAVNKTKEERTNLSLGLLNPNDIIKPIVNPIIDSPLDVKVINFLLKSFYAVIILAYLPFSGIENFFVSPLPPDMDSLSGQLRFWGLQAVLGPDYLVDYDAPLSDEDYEDEDAPPLDEDPTRDPSESPVDGPLVSDNNDYDGGDAAADAPNIQNRRDLNRFKRHRNKNIDPRIKNVEKRRRIKNVEKKRTNVRSKFSKRPPSRYGKDHKETHSSYSSYSGERLNSA